ncbi:hypothetical protein EJ04DRAFT_567617 [Polyplosphaeria fusca]|uniref:Cyanovirin-N domain-containing protein n=1 Tax=Polyplosphaeria fusca TaxID=682080 RepID=A0A9P4QNC3_9PLEO|nr:hypothetical protein EJ04DRAFT_567617 [Polyplosphaeria fusca]
MEHTTRTRLLFFACITATLAAPASIRDTTAKLLSTECNNLQLRMNWLTADCLTGEDSTTRIQSAVALSNKLSNSDGALKWQTDGHFERTCQDCALSSLSLTCRCRPSWGTGKTGLQNSTLDLSRHIGVYDGHLLSDMTGAPLVPDTPSPYPVPRDFSYHFGGEATCDGVSADMCTQVKECTTASPVNRTDAREAWWTFSEPVECYVPVIYFPDAHYVFSRFKIMGEGAWEVRGFADEGCTGEPVEVLGEGDVGVCKVLGERVRAVSVRPLFNGDAR